MDHGIVRLCHTSRSTVDDFAECLQVSLVEIGAFTRLDIGYDLDTGFVEVFDHALEVWVSLLVHGKDPSITCFRIDGVSRGELRSVDAVINRIEMSLHALPSKECHASCTGQSSLLATPEQAGRPAYSAREIMENPPTLSPNPMPEAR